HFVPDAIIQRQVGNRLPGVLNVAGIKRIGGADYRVSESLLIELRQTQIESLNCIDRGRPENRVDQCRRQLAKVEPSAEECSGIAAIAAQQRLETHLPAVRSAADIEVVDNIRAPGDGIAG